MIFEAMFLVCDGCGDAVQVAAMRMPQGLGFPSLPGGHPLAIPPDWVVSKTNAGRVNCAKRECSMLVDRKDPDIIVGLQPPPGLTLATH